MGMAQTYEDRVSFNELRSLSRTAAALMMTAARAQPLPRHLPEMAAGIAVGAREAASRPRKEPVLAPSRSRTRPATFRFSP